MTMPAQRPGKSRQDWSTPTDFLDAVERRFGPIDFDLAASHENTKSPAHFTRDDDALSKDWTRLVGNLWLNPEYAEIAPWAAKCSLTAPSAGRILMLTPASVGANWFTRYVHGHAYVLALNPRLKFDGAPDVFPKDLILSVYGSGLIGFAPWRWKK